METVNSKGVANPSLLSSEILDSKGIDDSPSFFFFLNFLTLKYIPSPDFILFSNPPMYIWLKDGSSSLSSFL